MTADLTSIVGSVQLLTNLDVTPPADNRGSIDTKVVVAAAKGITGVPALELWVALCGVWLADPGVVAIGAVQEDRRGGEWAVEGAELDVVVGQGQHEMLVLGVVGAVEDEAGLGDGDDGGDEAEDDGGELHLEGLDVGCGCDDVLTFAELT